MNPAMLFAGSSAALDLIGGVFSYLASKEVAAGHESRARMIRLEAETEATRYAEQAKSFSAGQKLAYLKSGVALSGSPLDVLDKDMLTAQENISAIRAGGRAQALGAENDARSARIAGRSALLAGISGGAGKLAMGAYSSSKSSGIVQAEKNLAFQQGSRYSPGYQGGWGGNGSSYGGYA